MPPSIPMRVPLTLRKMKTNTCKIRVFCGNVSYAHVNRSVQRQAGTIPDGACVSPITQHITVFEMFNPGGY